jgi:hypothetical protein
MVFVVGNVKTSKEIVEDNNPILDDPLWTFGDVGVVQMRFGLDGSNPGPIEYIEQALVSANNYIKSWCIGNCVKLSLISVIPPDLKIILDDLANSEALFFLFSDSESYAGGTNAKANAYKKIVDNTLTLLLNWFHQDCNGGAVSPYTVTTSSKFKHQTHYYSCVKSTNPSLKSCSCNHFRDN